MEVSHIKSLSDILADTKNYDNTQISPSEFNTLKRVLTTWPFEKLFPALDLFRLVLLHSHGSYHFGQESELHVFEHLLQNMSAGAIYENSKLVTLRVFANLFRGAKETAIKLGGGLTNTLTRLTPFIRTEKKPNQVALSYLLLNYSITLHGQKDSTVPTTLFNFIVEFLQTKQDEESLYRIIVALGTLRSSLTTEQVKSALTLIQNNQTTPSDNGRTKEALNDLASTL